MRKTVRPLCFNVGLGEYVTRVAEDERSSRVVLYTEAVHTGTGIQEHHSGEGLTSRTGHKQRTCIIRIGGSDV